jgi:hypothetical protein
MGAYDFIPYFAPAELEGNQYLNDLFWVIYVRLASFTQMGAYSLASAERGVDLTQEEFPAVNASVAGAALPQCLKVSSNRFGRKLAAKSVAAHLRLAHSNPTSCCRGLPR